MKSNDTIKLFGRSLFVQFGSTGETRNVNSLNLDEGLTFSRDGSSISAKYHKAPETTGSILIERFSSDTLATNAYQSLESVVRRHVRYRRVANFFKSSIKWGFIPLLLAVLALALNMGLTRAIGPNQQQLGAALEPLAPLPAQLPPGSVQTSSTVVQPAIASASELSKAMADGAKSGKYTVQLSKGKKGTLYVFSDPSCPHCQDLEPELDKLKKDYTIFIFPVTVIGGEDSSHRVAKLLCAKADSRASQWNSLVKGDDLRNQECADGVAATQANDQFFRVMRFAGTPTIINSAGEQTPDSVPNTADAINQWMSGSLATTGK